VGALALGAHRKDPVLAIPGAYALITLVLLSALGTRLPHYLLPMYPAAAVSIGLLAAQLPELASAPIAAAGLALLWTTSGSAPFDPNVLPATETRALAEAAPPGVPIYTLDWYAPAMGYYSDRPWQLLGTSGGWMKYVGSVDLFAAAGNVSLAPPWPDGHWLVAGEPQQLAWAARDLGMPLDHPLAASGGFELWVAR
jgi:hypothetical protein